jgi:hypothetical protein
MEKLSKRIGNCANKPAKRGRAALPAFVYEDGYIFSATDLGKRGVKIQLNHEYDTGGAIILPPRKVGECGRWLLGTLEQDSDGLPTQLRTILERLSKQSGFRPTLQRGDKKKIREALRALKSRSSKVTPEGPVLGPLSKKAV